MPPSLARLEAERAAMMASEYEQSRPVRVLELKPNSNWDDRLFKLKTGEAP